MAQTRWSPNVAPLWNHLGILQIYWYPAPTQHSDPTAMAWGLGIGSFQSFPSDSHMQQSLGNTDSNSEESSRWEESRELIQGLTLFIRDPGVYSSGLLWMSASSLEACSPWSPPKAAIVPKITTRQDNIQWKGGNCLFPCLFFTGLPLMPQWLDQGHFPTLLNHHSQEEWHCGACLRLSQLDLLS